MFRRSLIILIVCLLFTGCNAKEQTYYSRFCDFEYKGTVSYAKSFLFMDCCTEWDWVVLTINKMDEVTSAETFEYYFYDSNGNEIPLENEVKATFHPTEDFKNKRDDDNKAKIYNLKTKTLIDGDITDTGDITFKTEECGIFIIMKYCDEEKGTLWISNLPDCNGECKSCSDEW